MKLFLTLTLCFFLAAVNAQNTAVNSSKPDPTKKIQVAEASSGRERLSPGRPDKWQGLFCGWNNYR